MTYFLAQIKVTMPAGSEVEVAPFTRLVKASTWAEAYSAVQGYLENAFVAGAQFDIEIEETIVGR